MVATTTVTPFVLAVLKYAFLALLYFFVFRAIRSVALDVSGRRAAAGAAAETKPVRAAKGGKQGKPGKAPTAVVVKTENGKKAGSYTLRDQLQIGRADACHIKLDDRYSSQFHARLYPKNGAWYVEDLGSTNGTYLNRQKVQGSAEVQAGDQIRIGRTVLELKR